MKIGCKSTKAVHDTFHKEEIAHFAEKSISDSLSNPPLSGRADTYYWDTRAGRLVALVFQEGEKWNCYFSFEGEVDFVEDGLYGRHWCN